MQEDAARWREAMGGALETRMAVVKSSSFRLYWITERSVKVPGTARSTRPPSGIRPTVGWFLVTEDPAVAAENPPTRSEPWPTT